MSFIQIPWGYLVGIATGLAGFVMPRISQVQQLLRMSKKSLFGLPGVSCKMVRGDPSHVLFTRGLYGHLMGSCLHYACYFEGPGKVCKVPAPERLAVIFKEVQVAYSQQEASCGMTNLRLSMFCDAKKPWANWANLDTKGREGKQLLPALLPGCNGLLGKVGCHLGHSTHTFDSNAICSVLGFWKRVVGFL